MLVNLRQSNRKNMGGADCGKRSDSIGIEIKTLKFNSKELEKFSPGFYVDCDGRQYFCLSEFLLVHGLPLTMESVHRVLDEVMSEFPGITVIEVAE